MSRYLSLGLFVGWKWHRAFSPKILFLSGIVSLILFQAPSLCQERANPYVPKEINIWLDKEFLKYYQNNNQAKDHSIYSTEGDEKELLRKLLEVSRLQLEADQILIRQNERIINLLKKLKK